MCYKFKDLLLYNIMYYPNLIILIIKLMQIITNIFFWKKQHIAIVYLKD